MDFQVEERRAWVRTSTHTVILDRDPEYGYFVDNPSGITARLIRVWRCSEPGSDKRGYLGAVCLGPGGFRRDDLTRLFRRLVRSAGSRAEAAQGRFDPVLDALERAADGAADALTLLRRAMADTEPDPKRLDDCEERLFALRAAARKHNVAVSDLPVLLERLDMLSAATAEANGPCVVRVAAIWGLMKP